MTAPAHATRVREGVGSPWLMLAMATLGFAVNFWAWALISPLGPLFRDKGTLGSLSESDVALMVAVPVLVGSLGRIPVGALTDRYGGRIMFPLVSLATVVPVLCLGLFAQSSYTMILVFGFFLGIGGTAFAVGVPFVNAWFPPERRGLVARAGGGGPSRSIPSCRAPDLVIKFTSARATPTAPSFTSALWHPKPHCVPARSRTSSCARSRRPISRRSMSTRSGRCSR